MGFPKNLFISIFVSVLGTLLVLGYFGLVPFFSNLTGASTPRDLGVRYNNSDLMSINQKTGIKYLALNGGLPKETISLQGQQHLDVAFTQEELTALMNQHSTDWRLYPIEDVQMKISAYGTVELTGVLRMDVIDEYGQATNMPVQVQNQLQDQFKYIKSNPRFYVRFKGSIENNKAIGEVYEAEIGRIPVGQDWLTANRELILGMVEDRLKNAGLFVENATFANGQVHFKGTGPQTIGFAR